jgi:DNA-binding Lrp family transcriptional regulator
MDNTDEKIIGILKDNSRSTIRDIAKKARLRPSTVHQRILKLKNNNTIEKFTIKLNNQAIGESFIVFMLIATEKDIDSSAFKDNHIKEVFGITGEYDLLLKMKFRDIKQFNEYIIKFRKRHQLKKTLTMVSTITLKEEL